ncbi:MAG: ABC transporter permease, partial [Methanothrix sp.]|nr:ABC transporter permease [Methanothrix sp.]
DECLMAPIALHSLLIGKALIGVVRGLISSVAFLLVSVLIAPSLHVGPMFLLGLALTCLTFAFLGVLAALLARSHEDMATFGSLILLPMSFLGGTFFSLSHVPEALRYALYVLPLTHSSLWLRAAALDQPLPWGSLIVLTAFLLAFLAGGMVALRRISV